MEPLYWPLKLRVGCEKSASLRWQTGGPPTDVDLTGCTLIAMIWSPQQFLNPIVTISQTPNSYGALSISIYPAASVPSVVNWQWLPAAVAALGLVPPLDELRLVWGINITFPGAPQDPLVRGPCTLKP
jgi:hypothetical protein